MDLVEACENLEALAAGRDPVSGAALPPTNPLNNARVIRALYTALLHLQPQVPDPAACRALPARAGQSWDADKDARLVAAFDPGTRTPELAEQHQRTRGAIQSRLVRLGRLQLPATGNP